MLHLGECTSPEAAILARDSRTVVLLPTGAVEQHGPHLPLLVDWLGGEELARRLAPHLRRAGYRPVLAPSLPYGVSDLALTWPGTISLATATLRRLLGDIVASLARHGFRRVVLTNYQADPGHLRALAAAQAAGARAGVQVVLAGFRPGAGESPMVNARVRALLRSPEPDREWHSGELETAMMLATRPSLVRRGIARRLPPAWVDFGAALAAGARRFEEIAPGGRGYFGWPAAARPETARRALALRARLIAAEVLAALDAGRPPAGVSARGGRRPAPEAVPPRIPRGDRGGPRGPRDARPPGRHAGVRGRGLSGSGRGAARRRARRPGRR